MARRTPTMSGPELLEASGLPLAEHPGLAVSERPAGTSKDGALAEPLRSLLLAVRAVRGRVRWRRSGLRGVGAYGVTFWLMWKRLAGS